MPDNPCEIVTTFDRVTRLIAVTVWPLVLASMLFIYRRSIDRVVRALAWLAERADELKIWQLEIKRKVEAVAEQTSVSNAAKNGENIPTSQKVAAKEIAEIVSTAPSSRSREILRLQVRERMEGFAASYEEMRKTMQSGEARTSEMNRITAQMRSLGLAARPFLKEFASATNSPGKRLAAIAILQVSPSSDYIDWLFTRLGAEQPFIFFQASLAILQCVRKYGPRRFRSLRRRILAGIQVVESYKGGPPDRNTLDILSAALRELERLHPNVGASPSS